jgi:hypothetical protein
LIDRLILIGSLQLTPEAHSTTTNPAMWLEATVGGRKPFWTNDPQQREELEENVFWLMVSLIHSKNLGCLFRNDLPFLQEIIQVREKK